MATDAGAGAGLDALLADLASAVGASPRDVLGLPVALALRHDISDESLFLSGVDGDLPVLVSAAFAAAPSGGSTVEVAERRWLRVDPVFVGTGPVAPGAAGGARVENVQQLAVGRRGPGPATRLEEATALRDALRATSERLASDLALPPDFKQIAKIGESAAADVRAVVNDVALSRDHVGRYLLDAADYFDDERIDQLGDGYVRVAGLWANFAATQDADLGVTIMALEHECAAWMRGAAEPPTRYAF